MPDNDNRLAIERVEKFLWRNGGNWLIMALGLGLSNWRREGTRMGPVIYRLVDGAFLERLILEYGKFLNVDLLSKMNWDILQQGSKRCIFYDALPTKKSNQSDSDFEKVEQEKISFLNSIRILPNTHVRDGITRLRTKTRGGRTSEVLEQKGVDTWIAVDAMKYALFGIADEIQIWTSDSDLYPVFEALQETRCKGTLRYMDGRTDQELIYSADQADPIRISHVIEWTKHIKFRFREDIRRLLWRELFTVEYHENRFQFVKDGEERFGCNMYNDGRFVKSAESQSIFPLADWVASNGGKISYTEVSRRVSEADQ